MTFEFGEYNGLVIFLSIGVWIFLQYAGHAVGMASSSTKKGSRQDLYQERVGKAGGIAAIGAVVSLVTQLIPIRIVSMIGWVTIVISILCIVAIVTGALAYRLPEPGPAGDDE